MEKGGLSVGFIANGNRTWAKREHGTDQPTMDQYLDAYMKGSERIKGVIEEARDMGFKLIAPWGMSDRNIIKRPLEERQCLYQVYKHYLIDLRDNFLHRPENSEVRLVHIGRRDRLIDEAPEVIRLIDEIKRDTQERVGMAVAVALDYGGLNERDRATEAWARAGCPGGIDGIKCYLDLSSQGVSYAPVDLIIRTGHKQEEAVRTNEFLYPYLNETRVIPNTCLLPDYTEDQFRADIQKFQAEKQNRGA